MNEDSAVTSQIGMNFAAPKALIPWPDRSVTTTLGAAKFMPIWLVSAESSHITTQLGLSGTLSPIPRLFDSRHGEKIAL